MHRILPAIIATAFCGERETIRDAHGKVVGTTTTDGNKTVYRDASYNVIHTDTESSKAGFGITSSLFLTKTTETPLKNKEKGSRL